MQAIDQEIKELFRILLAINTPFAVQTSTERSECAWSNSLNITLPNASDQIRIKLRQDTFAAFPIVSLHYCLEPVVEEEEGKRRGRRECLDGSIHVTRNAEIDQTSTW